MEAERTGELIREVRKEKGMTQDELAAKIHVTRSAVSRWERGLGLPEVSILEQLADVLDISVTEFMHGKREEVIPTAEQDYRELSRSVKKERTAQKKRMRLFLYLMLAIIAAIVLAAVISHYPPSDAYLNESQ